jgi:ribonuclease HI
MEMIAAIEALSALKSGCQVTLYTDSKYLKDGITLWINKWIKSNWLSSKREPVKNVDLWQVLFNLSLKHQIQWEWVKGHSGDVNNDLVDKIAVEQSNLAKNLAKDKLKI